MEEAITLARESPDGTIPMDLHLIGPGKEVYNFYHLLNHSHFAGNFATTPEILLLFNPMFWILIW
jgi:hypothetical protein